MVNEQAFYKDSINNCSDLADAFVNAIGTIMYCLIKTLWSHPWQMIQDNNEQVENHCTSQKLKTPYRSEIVW